MTGPDSRTPEELLRAASGGDRAAFGRLMETFDGFLLDLADRGIDPRLRAILAPEDVTQDVKITALRWIEGTRFQSLAAFRGWLETVTRNRLADLRRRHLAAKRTGGGGPSLEASVGHSSGGGSIRLRDLVPSPDASPGSVLSRREAAESLEKALAHLRPAYREILRLLEIEQVSVAEAAARLGKKAGTVRKTLERALRACREEMVRQGLLGGPGQA